MPQNTCHSSLVTCHPTNPLPQILISKRMIMLRRAADPVQRASLQFLLHAGGGYPPPPPPPPGPPHPPPAASPPVHPPRVHADARTRADPAAFQHGPVSHRHI